MAEERNLGYARAPETTEEDAASKEELQRRMDQARESITQTVTEIKDSVTTQYNTVKESINDALDWREQFRRHPVTLSLGAVSVGFLVGYGVAGIAKSGSSDYTSDYSSADYTSNYAQNYSTGSFETTQDQKPGLMDKFKESRAFDRLNSELNSLTDRVIDNLSNVAQTVVLPALTAKLSDLIGFDLSKSQQSTSTQYESGSRAATASTNVGQNQGNRSETRTGAFSTGEGSY